MKQATPVPPVPKPAGGRSVGRALRRLALALVVLAVIAFVILHFFGVFEHKVGLQSGQAPEVVPVGDTPLVAVRKVRITSSEAASGKVMPVHEAEVASQIMEKVVEVNVKAGQAVKKGDVLIRLDDTVLKSRLSQAQAALAANKASLTEAQGELERVRQLREKKIVSQSDLEHAEAVFKTLQAKCQGDERAVAEADATLTFATILAPMDGVVIDKRVEAGGMARPGQILVTLYDAMQVVANVRESLVNRLKEGQQVEIEIDRPALTCEGTISEIVPEGDPVARTFPVKVVGPCRPGVRKGMYAKLVIPLDAQELLVIPRSAVTRIGQLDVVQVAEGQSLRRRTVQLGRTLTADNREVVQVLAGLAEGEKVADRPGPAGAASAARAAPHD